MKRLLSLLACLSLCAGCASRLKPGKSGDIFDFPGLDRTKLSAKQRARLAQVRHDLQRVRLGFRPARMVEEYLWRDGGTISWNCGDYGIVKHGRFHTQDGVRGRWHGVSVSLASSLTGGAPYVFDQRRFVPGR